MNVEIEQFVREEIRVAINNLRDEIVAIITERDDARAANDKQLVVSTKQTMALIGEKIQSDVTADIMHSINTNLMPKVNQAMQWVNYNMEDGSAVVDKYRRAVESKQFGDDLAITDGSQDKRIISQNVRTYFSDSSDSSDEYA
jgi:hypothetical protein